MTTVTPPVMEAADTEIVDPTLAIVDNDTGTVDANPVAPSPTDVPDAKEPLNLLDVMKSVIEKPKVVEAPSAPEGEQVEPIVEAPADAEPKAEDDANLPFHNHPRWRAVLSERDSLKEPAESFQQITSFMQQHGLVPEEVAEGYDIMAKLKSSDPVVLGEARDWFHSRLTALDTMLGRGEELPTDLQERVDNGLLDEAGAAEIAQLRAGNALIAAKDTGNVARTAEAERVAAVTKNANEMASGVMAWETAVKASDPDYAKKAELIETTCRAIVQRDGKAPANSAEAVALVKRAHGEVTASFKALLPKPRAITPGPTGATVTAAAAPKTLAEAMSRAVGG